MALVALLAFTAWWIARPAANVAIEAERVSAPSVLETRAPESAARAVSPERAERPIPITRRADEGPSINVTTSELVGEVQRLELRHRAGDAEAGYPLFTLLEQCARAPAIAEQLRRDRRELPAGPVSLPDSVVNEASFLESECARLPPGLLARRFDFLESAATHGDVRARVDFASYPPEYFATTDGLVRNAEKVVEFKAKAVAWLHNAADRGSPLALLKLAGLYREGVLVERDDVSALAFYLAWDEAGGSEGGVDPYRQQREWGMTAAQVQQARERQRQILARCCR